MFAASPLLGRAQQCKQSGLGSHLCWGWRPCLNHIHSVVMVCYGLDLREHPCWFLFFLHLFTVKPWERSRPIPGFLLLLPSPSQALTRSGDAGASPAWLHASLPAGRRGVWSRSSFRIELGKEGKSWGLPVKPSSPPESPLFFSAYWALSGSIFHASHLEVVDRCVLGAGMTLSGW